MTSEFLPISLIESLISPPAIGALTSRLASGLLNLAIRWPLQLEPHLIANQPASSLANHAKRRSNISSRLSAGVNRNCDSNRNSISPAERCSQVTSV